MMRAVKKDYSREALFFKAAEEAVQVLKSQSNTSKASVIVFDTEETQGPWFWVETILKSEKWETFLKENSVTAKICVLTSYQRKPLIWLSKE